MGQDIIGTDPDICIPLSQVGNLRGSRLHSSGLNILEAAKRSIAELQPIIERAEADSIIEQVGH